MSYRCRYYHRSERPKYDPSFPWNKWPSHKFGMDEQDGFHELWDKYNTQTVQIQDVDAFLLDLKDLANESDTRQEFEFKFEQRRKKRLFEIYECIEQTRTYFQRWYGPEWPPSQLEEVLERPFGQDALAADGWDPKSTLNRPKPNPWGESLRRFFRELDMSSLALFFGDIMGAAVKTKEQVEREENDRIWFERSRKRRIERFLRHRASENAKKEKEKAQRQEEIQKQQEMEAQEELQKQQDLEAQKREEAARDADVVLPPTPPASSLRCDTPELRHSDNLAIPSTTVSLSPPVENDHGDDGCGDDMRERDCGSASRKRGRSDDDDDVTTSKRQCSGQGDTARTDRQPAFAEGHDANAAPAPRAEGHSVVDPLPDIAYRDFLYYYPGPHVHNIVDFSTLDNTTTWKRRRPGHYTAIPDRRSAFPEGHPVQVAPAERIEDLSDVEPWFTTAFDEYDLRRRLRKPTVPGKTVDYSTVDGTAARAPAATASIAESSGAVKRE